MSQSHALQQHISQLAEIRSILNAMKNLSFMEIHKLSQLQAKQNQVLAAIVQVADDFLNFHPTLALNEGNKQHISIVIGSERGFCGDYNESAIGVLEQEASYCKVIAVGNRLVNKLQDKDIPITSELPGANITEDVPGVINQLIEVLNQQFSEQNVLGLAYAGVRLSAIYHDHNSGNLCNWVIFPFPQMPSTGNRHRLPPVLNLNPAEFYADVIHHYLFAVFHAIFYNALSAENHQRLQHLERAVNHLDEDSVNLRRKLQTYRQEEITEEIEVILLNAEAG